MSSPGVRAVIIVQPPAYGVHPLRGSQAHVYTRQMDQPVHSRRRPAAAKASATNSAPAKTTKPASKRAVKPKARTNDPERTMAEILAVATEEFASKGLSGARIDAIADATRTSKRMIYYYFGSKEGLYLAVLEESYRSVRTTEGELHLADLSPEDALARLVAFTFDHHWGSQDYIRLVMTENIQRGEYLAQSKIIQKLNVPAINAIRALYERGVASGVFRPGLDAIDIHASISALCFFNVSNQYTFDLIFKRNGKTPKALQARRDNIVDMILRYVRK